MFKAVTTVGGTLTFLNLNENVLVGAGRAGDVSGQ
jgi:hypothetical protein